LKPNLKIINTENIVDFIGSIFERRSGEEYLGEPVTMGQHMLQGATLAEQNKEPDEIVVGALLHDIGHFTSEFGTFSMADTADRYHENAGGDLLENFFPSVITDCCRYHVAAKRYLCATDPQYFNKLSDASVHSLNLQGGPMSEAEIINFKRNPNLKQILTVRLYDDAAKVPKMATPSFRHFAPLVHKMVNNFVPANG
jgi:predicted HD phosphohydrolase